MEHTRREILSTALTVGAIGATGCLHGDNTEGSTGFTAQVSFPVVQDFASNIVPEGAEANSLVPIGQHGHGWEPSPNIQREVSDSEAFVYVMEGFQPWADDMVENVRRDNPEVSVIEAGAGVDLLELGEYGHRDHHGKEEHEKEGHGDGEGHEDGHDDESHEDDTHHEDKEGHEGGGEHDGGDDHHENEGEDEHDHEQENADPHFWLDPLRAKTVVDNLADGLGEAHGEDGYEGSADAYRSRLDDLHGEFESTLSDASQDTVLVAGHNAFSYLGARYGFEVVTLTGVSPDEQPSARDIDRAQSLIEDEGIGYVLAPVFESDTAAQTLMSDTSAREVLPVTSFPSFKQEWLEGGMGYIEVMKNVNLSSLEKALEA